MLNNKQLMESLPELPSLVKDKSEQFLSATGAAFTKVCQSPDFHTLSSNTYYCKNTNIILFDNPTVWQITLALWFESLFSLIMFVRWALIDVYVTRLTMSGSGWQIDHSSYSWWLHTGSTFHSYQAEKYRITCTIQQSQGFVLRLVGY